MKNFILTLLCAGVMTFTGFSQVEIGSYDIAAPGVTCWTMNGGCMANTVAKLEDPANFGAAGTVSESVNITHYLPGSLTSAVLNNLDIFFIGYIVDGTVPATDLAVLADWVSAGGTMIITADNGFYDDVAEFFGHPSSSQAANPTTALPSAVNHPIFNGPFGTFTSYTSGGSIGFFTVVDAIPLSEYAGGQIALMEKSLGSGKLILSGDVCTISLQTSAGTGINTINDILTANMFAYAIDQCTYIQDASGLFEYVLADNLPLNISNPNYLTLADEQGAASLEGATYDLLDDQGTLVLTAISELPNTLVVGESYTLVINKACGTTTEVDFTVVEGATVCD